MPFPGQNGLDMGNWPWRFRHQDFFKISFAFTLLSVLAIELITGMCIFLIYKNHIYRNAEQDARSIGRAIMEQEYAVLFAHGRLSDLSLYTGTPEAAAFDQRMRKYLKPFHMVKIKIFNPERKIIYSTDPRIIGSVIGTNGNLDAALAGQSISKLKTKTDVWDLDGELQFNLDLVETYLPLVNSRGAIAGVFEIYADVSPYRGEFARIFSLSMLAVLAVLALVFGVILLVLNQMNIVIFKRTNQLIRNQDILQASQKLTQGLMDNAFDAIVVIDSSGVIARWNLRAESLFGWPAREAVGEKLSDLIIPRQFHEDYRRGINRYLAAAGKHILNKQAELTARNKEGVEFPVELTVSSLAWDNKYLFIGVVRDISARKRMEIALINLTNTDSLTGIANRRYFQDYAQRELLRACREKKPLSLMLVDVDFFKLFNDHYGHQQGDECLKKVSRCLSHNLERPGDLAARYGGEEFVVILPGTDLNGLAKIAEKLRMGVEGLKIEHALSKVSRCVTVSLGGAAVIPFPDISLEALIKAADVALYRAKARSRNTFQVTHLEVGASHPVC